MIDRGAHVNAIGAIVPSGIELAADVLARCSRVIVDSPEQARKLSRELIDFYGSGDAGWTRVRRLSDVVANADRRSSSDDVTLFKSLGMGISDLALGIEICRAARRRGIGRPIGPESRAMAKSATTEVTE